MLRNPGITRWKSLLLLLPDPFRIRILIEPAAWDPAAGSIISPPMRNAYGAESLADGSGALVEGFCSAGEVAGGGSMTFSVGGVVGSFFGSAGSVVDGPAGLVEDALVGARSGAAVTGAAAGAFSGTVTAASVAATAVISSGSDTGLSGPVQVDAVARTTYDTEPAGGALSTQVRVAAGRVQTT
ncbi:hypothetical protein JIG36_44035 [Actinoplanes sp. LDG1-06]|uniref:Uncharacterized protein n=1 Tax=Paractinoplanes ovalisporus TaxID=2810368 RepID=A0ABS2ARP3_9ACTN|nr:hypothetical protein [Actinoplanes ovalisporus]MBM2622494.1 hypothetical protein [Actinoplanes ovalisporus]